MSIEIIFARNDAITAGASISVISFISSFIDDDDEGTLVAYEDSYTALEIPGLKVVCHELEGGRIYVSASRDGAIKPILTAWLEKNGIPYTVE